MLRLEFLQKLEEIKLTASGKLKKFLTQHIFNKETWKKASVASEQLTQADLDGFIESFRKYKDSHTQDVKAAIDNIKALDNINALIMRASILFALSGLDTRLHPEMKIERFEGCLDLYKKAKKIDSQLMLIQTLPQSLLESILGINKIENLKEGLQEIDLHADLQVTRFKIACLVEFYIRSRRAQDTYTASGVMSGWIVAPIASRIPGMSFFGYHDKETKVEAAEKMQQAIIKGISFREILAAAANGPMTNGQSKLFYDVVTNLANFHEPNAEVSHQDSVLGVHASRTPSPSRS